jgi:hypothetical protein
MPRGLNDRHLTRDNRQDQPQLVFCRYYNRPSHQIAPFSGARLYDPANFLEAGHNDTTNHVADFKFR